MIDSSTLRAMAGSPGEYRRRLLIDCGGTLVPLAEAMDPWQAADFEAMDSAWKAIAGIPGQVPTHRRAWVERHRGASKTQDTAAAALWAIAFARRKITGKALATDSDQATILAEAIERLTTANPWLQEVVEVQKRRVHNL